MPIYNLYPLQKLLKDALKNPDKAEENIREVLKIVNKAIEHEEYEGEDFR
mgnify:CR=1 FL=1|tara:strand:+ start:478 stop:627 length:150 start_codon:yes stop_codon:yes gene_type:complete